MIVVSDELPRSVMRVKQALDAAGIEAKLVELPQSARTSDEAAAAIGCAVAQIAKSIVFRRTDMDPPVDIPVRLEHLDELDI